MVNNNELTTRPRSCVKMCARPPRQRLRHSGPLSATVAVASSISPPMIGHDFGGTGAAASIFTWFVVFYFLASTPAAAAIVRVFMASSPFIFIFVANTALHEIKQIKTRSILAPVADEH